MLKDGADDEYADAMSTYLALAIRHVTQNRRSRYARWHNSGDFVAGVFATPEQSQWSGISRKPTRSLQVNPGNWMAQVEWVAE